MLSNAGYVQKPCQSNVTDCTIRLTRGKSVLHWMFAVPLIHKAGALACKLRLRIYPNKNHLYIPPQISLNMEIWMPWITSHLNEHGQMFETLGLPLCWQSLIEQLLHGRFAHFQWHSDLTKILVQINGHPSQKWTKHVDVTDWWLHVFLATANKHVQAKKQAVVLKSCSVTNTPRYITPTNEPEVHTEHACEDI